MKIITMLFFNSIIFIAISHAAFYEPAPYSQPELNQPLVDCCKEKNLEKLIQWTKEHPAINDLFSVKLDYLHVVTKVAPLHIAVLYNFLEGARYLLENGADLEKRCYSGLSSIFYAAQSGSQEIIDLLYSYAPQDHINYEQEPPLIAPMLQYSPLHVAIHNKHYHLIHFFLKKGISPSCAPSQKTSARHCNPLFLILTHGHLKALDFFFEKPIELSAQGLRNLYVSALIQWYKYPERITKNTAASKIKDYFKSKKNTFKCFVSDFSNPKIIKLLQDQPITTNNFETLIFQNIESLFLYDIQNHPELKQLESYVSKKLNETVAIINNKRLKIFTEHFSNNQIVYSLRMQELTGKSSRILPAQLIK